MDCTKCGSSNDASARFCSTCGNRLEQACPSCSAPVLADAAFCSNCGTALGTTAPSGLNRYIPEELMQKLDAARRGRSMVGERRTVTMLFADLKGSTAAAETMDPEEWADIVNGVFTHLIKPVYRYEGTLARLMGDAVLAFFGAPIAHEDDPERAIRAGLEMLRDAQPYARAIQQEHGIDLDLRVGINTGLVVVGEVGSDLRVEYTALGDAVNLAARMEQTAEPGTLQITEETKHLVEGLFEFEDLGGIEVKGKAVPVTAFRVTGVRERPATTRGLGSNSLLVGRNTELDSLREAVNVVRAGGGAIASVIGEAGVGKTRLVAALEQELEGASCTSPWAPSATTDGLVRWGRARCLSFDTSVPYAPFVEFFRRLIGIEPADPPEIARARIETAIEHLPDTDPSLTTPYICALLGVDPGPKASGVIESMDAPELQRRTFAAILSWIQGCLSAGPGLLILEDLHWADSVSLSLVEELLRLTERAPLGVVFLMRPYKEDGSWGIHEAAVRHHEHRYTPIRLNPLDVDAQRALVRALLTDPEPQDQLVEAIVERSGGNPFFLEELVRLQLEGDGQASASLPDSVTGLLTARLDRLDPGTRLVAQFASVFGREFDLNDLSLLASGQVEVDRAVQDLLAGGIFEERERIPELELGFRHALTREAAYGSMLLKTRRDLHGRVAEHLIGRDGDAASIAQHLVAANEGPRAVPYLVTAGDQASRAMALSDAISLYSQAAAWLGDPPDVEMALRVHEGLGAAYGLIPDLSEVSATYQRLLEVGTANDAPALQVTALNRLGFATATLGGSYDDATLYLEQAKALAERVQDHMGLAEYHMAACMIATARGDMEIAAAHDAQTAQLGEALGAGQLLAGGLIQRVMSLSAAVRLDEAAEALEHAKRATEGVEDPSALIGISMAEHFVLLGSGRLKESFDLAEKTSELARRVGSSQAAYATVQAGSVAALLGDYEASIAFFAEALRLAEESHQPYHAARAASGLVGRYAQVGRDDDYMDQMKAKAIAHLKAPMGTMTASSVYGELGWAALEAGRDEEAREWFETALAGSSSTRHFEEPSLRLGLALAQLHAGDKASAVNEVEAASRFLEEKPLPMFKPVRALVAAAVHGPDDPAGSLASLTEAAAMSESLGMRWLTWRIHGARALMLGRSGSPEAATEAISSAREVIGGIASDIVDDGLRSAFSEHSLSRLAGIASPTQ